MVLNNISVEDGVQTMVFEKWIDQKPIGRKSVNQFFLKIVPELAMSHTNAGNKEDYIYWIDVACLPDSN